jgi:hypothetical protein
LIKKKKEEEEKEMEMFINGIQMKQPTHIDQT